MHRISLSFESRPLEAKYRLETELETQFRFFSFVILEACFNLVFLIYTMITSVNKFHEMAKFLSILFLIFLLFLLKRWSFVYLSYVLKFIFLCLMILFIELIKSLLEVSQSHENVIFLVIPFQLMLSMLWLTRTNWLRCAMYYFCVLSYFFIRLVDIDSDVSFVIIELFLCFLCFCYMAYTQEKKEKGYYKSMNDSNENLNYFKGLLQNIIPSPIFIMDSEKKQLKFHNNSAWQFLARNSPNFEHIELSASVRKQFIQDYDRNFNEFNCFLSKLALITEKEKDIPMSSGGEIPFILKKYFENPLNLPLSFDQKDQNVDFLTLNTTILLKSFLEEDEKISHLESLKHKRFYEMKVLKIFWEKTVCLLMIFNENTDAFRISELVNLDLYKNQLLASVSHDLRTPLNGLNGMLEMTISKTKDLEVKETLTFASKSAKLLNFLINDILDFSQINFKKLRLNIEEVDLKEIIEEIRNLIEFQAKAKKINFLIELPMKEFRPIASDANRIKQILMNLLSNSLKFTHEGFIKLRLEDVTEKLGFVDYKFIVEDTGIGIKSEDIPKLFKLFGRLEGPKSLNKTGIGLGLTISKMLSKLLSPNYPEGLQVESDYGKGARFYFHLTTLLEGNCEDFEKIEEKTGIMLPEQRTYEMFDEKTTLFRALNTFEQFGNKKILIVDDDLINIMIAEEYLEFFKMKSLRALNGLEALKLVQKDILENKQEICLIVMDCNMPILDGFQASEKILEFLGEERAKNIPILAVTANLTIECKESCRKAGMEFFLEKPMRREDFKKMVEEILKIKI